MSNQATADLDNVNPDYEAGLADAGPDQGGAWEGRESDPGSANPWSDTADGPPSAGPGREVSADGLDDMSEREAYLAALDGLNIDELPMDAGETQPAAESEEPRAESAEETNHEPAQTPQGKPTQFRLRPRAGDPVDERAFAILKADQALGEESQGFTMEIALAMAKASLGLTSDLRPPTSEEDAPADALGETAPDGSTSAVEAQIRELRRQAIAAKRFYDAEAEADLEEQILNLEDRLPELRLREETRRRQEAEGEAAYTRALESSWAAVCAEFPEATDPEGAFAARVRAIDEAWGEAGDKRYDDPDKARLIGGIVAKEQGLKPVSQRHAAPARTSPNGRHLPAPASSRPSVAAPRPGPAVVLPASGSARIAADSPTHLEAQIASADTPEAYAAIRERMLAGV